MDANVNRNIAGKTNGTTQTSKRDWFRAGRWKREGSPCYFVEGLCHGAFSFFYDETTQDSHQPRLYLDLGDNKIKRVGYPEYIRIKKEDRSFGNSAQCPYSPIANHIVLYSFHNGMLGEFYTRTLSGLIAIQRTFAGSSKEEIFRTNWNEQTQLYLHTDSEKPVLDGHFLFLDSLTSNPLLPFRTFFDRANCRCVRRLFFCGYEARPEDNGNNVTIKRQPAVWNGHRSGKEFLVPEVDMNREDLRTWENFFPISRQHLLAVIAENGRIDQLVSEFRADVFSRQNIEIHSNVTRRIVGLSQRNGRRSWINMESSIDHCNNVFRLHGVACIEVNVEDESSNPLAHLVMHRSLDMLIGIHGASLTDGVWMKEDSFVLELLPYVPDGLVMGPWTRSITTPTPLGVIFTSTNLNHVGYRLGVRSIPQCKECWGNSTRMHKFLKEAEHRWDSRNFEVHHDIVEEAVSRFLLVGHANGVDCNSFLANAQRDNHTFILYNVLCANTSVQHHSRVSNYVKPHHFYYPHEKHGLPFGIELNYMVARGNPRSYREL